ncbi:MAG: acyl-CoA thioesterase [Candidatus Eremiobacter antarcticus]|nr:acyl-CoA thioesterase [Candidatus Eremiobacteraeota bacterium]PZR60814.1 MAG: acyl-CoA thioesterase [Candidatus Eremiobacter sp. RRmetagenome_bin22]
MQEKQAARRSTGGAPATAVLGSASELPGKPVAASASVLATLVEVADTNPMGNIHGGVIMKLADQAAAAAAIRHSQHICVTASIDRLDFLNPVRVGDMVELKSAVNYTHRSSMEVGVRIEAERLQTGERKHVATALLIFVALDENCRPVTVPPVIPETPEEQARFRDGQARYKERAEKRQRERSSARPG